MGTGNYVGSPAFQEQLEVWSRQGAVAVAAATYREICGVLESAPALRDVGFDVYLQGSYRNATNIRGDSDVDVVVELRSTFFSDTRSLTPHESALHQAAHVPASYQLDDFRHDVRQAFARHFGEARVHEGNKALKIESVSGLLPADVLPCAHLRKYKRFLGPSYATWTDGVVFFTQRDHRRVENFPKVHYENGVSKNSIDRTNANYKPSVRVLKNIRTHLEREGLINDELAPSYFVECLLYNAPDSIFRPNHLATIIDFVDWFLKTDRSRLVCQSEQALLFGPTPEQWDETQAVQFVSAVIQLLARFATGA